MCAPGQDPLLRFDREHRALTVLAAEVGDSVKHTVIEQQRRSERKLSVRAVKAVQNGFFRARQLEYSSIAIGALCSCPVEVPLAVAHQSRGWNFAVRKV